jgi:hypothetical protein
MPVRGMAAAAEAYSTTRGWQTVPSLSSVLEELGLPGAGEHFVRLSR